MVGTLRFAQPYESGIAMLTLRRLPDAGGFRGGALHAFRHFARDRALLLEPPQPLTSRTR